MLLAVSTALSLLWFEGKCQINNSNDNNDDADDNDNNHNGDDDDDDDDDDDNKNKNKNNDDNDNNSIQRRNSRFFAISSLRREPFQTTTLKWLGRNRVQITCNTSSAYHVQDVLRATRCEGTAVCPSVYLSVCVAVVHRNRWWRSSALLPSAMDTEVAVESNPRLAGPGTVRAWEEIGTAGSISRRISSFPGLPDLCVAPLLECVHGVYGEGSPFSPIMSCVCTRDKLN